MNIKNENIINLSEFKEYLINYGKKYGIQKLNEILHEQFYGRVNNKLNNKNLNNFLNSKDLLNNLKKEIDESLNKEKKSSSFNNNESIIRSIYFSESDIPYKEILSKKNNNEVSNLPKNSCRVPLPSKLMIQCCPVSSKYISSFTNNSIKYHLPFDGKKKEEFLKKNFEEINIKDSIDLGLINHSKSVSCIEDEKENNYNYNNNSIDFNDSSNNSFESNFDKDNKTINRKIIGNNEIMKYKVQMYNRKRQLNLEKRKFNQKNIEQDEYPVFKDFLYPRWYQHQSYYTGVNNSYFNNIYQNNLNNNNNM